MKRVRLTLMSAICAAMIAASLFISAAPMRAQEADQLSTDAKKHKPPPSPTAYDPYPTGILPADLDTEIARVRAEVAFIENEAIGEWHALPPPVLTGQPPTLQNTGMRANQLLGKLMNFDETMSPLGNRACGFCHMPYAGFSGPIPSVNLTMIAYPGSFQF